MSETEERKQAGELLDRRMISDQLREVAATLRLALENIGRRFGPQAETAITEAIDAAITKLHLD